MLRVLTLSSLFPDSTRPEFGIFVERQTLGLAAHPGVALSLIAPVGLPPWPASLHPHYRPRARLPRRESWKGRETLRPRFTTLPGTGGRYHVAGLIRALVPLCDARRGSFDVIDAEFFFPDGPAAVALGRRYGVPVSIKARGADIHHWGKGATGRQVIAAGRAADGMLAVSAAMKRDMVALGLPGERIRVHHTGVDLDRFVPCDRAAARIALGLSGPLVVSVGALIARKRHDIVIEAMGRLPGATLLIAGEGPERPRLEALIAQRGLGGRVRLLGTVSHDTLPQLFGAADASALASSSEGLANAWVESLACGTPIAITDVGGARELLTDEQAGRIVAPHPDAFAEALATLLAHPPPRAAVRAAALPFTWEANTAALYAHLSGLVAQARG